MFEIDKCLLPAQMNENFKPRNYHVYNAQFTQPFVRSIWHELENIYYIGP